MCNFSRQWWTKSLNKLTKDFALSQSQIILWRSSESFVVETWAFKVFTVANLRQLSTQLIVPNYINNWLVCHPGPGSLVFGGKVTSTIRSSNTRLAPVTSWSHQGFHQIKAIAMGRCFAWLNAIPALTIILMVTLKTICLPMILSEETVLTKRKMLQIHMVTFSFESSRKDRL